MNTNVFEEDVPFEQVCDELHISRTSAYKWMKSGRFPQTYKIGIRRFVARRDLNRFKSDLRSASSVKGH
jgi:hypothetical protein